MNIVSDSISIGPLEQTISIYNSLFQHIISGLPPKLYIYIYIKKLSLLHMVLYHIKLLIQNQTLNILNIIVTKYKYITCHIYIYIYIYRERERERERLMKKKKTHVICE